MLLEVVIAMGMVSQHSPGNVARKVEPKKEWHTCVMGRFHGSYATLICPQEEQALPDGYVPRGGGLIIQAWMGESIGDSLPAYEAIDTLTGGKLVQVLHGDKVSIIKYKGKDLREWARILRDRRRHRHIGSLKKMKIDLPALDGMAIWGN